MGRKKRKVIGYAYVLNAQTRRFRRTPVYEERKQRQPTLAAARPPVPQPPVPQPPPPYVEEVIIDNEAPATAYYRKKSQLQDAWKDAMPSMQRAYFASLTPSSSACCICQKVPETIVAVCSDCNPRLQFCKQCCFQYHQDNPKCLFHKPLIYMVSKQIYAASNSKFEGKQYVFVQFHLAYL